MRYSKLYRLLNILKTHGFCRILIQNYKETNPPEI